MHLFLEQDPQQEPVWVENARQQKSTQFNRNSKTTNDAFTCNVLVENRSRTPSTNAASIHAWLVAMKKVPSNGPVIALTSITGSP